MKRLKIRTRLTIMYTAVLTLLLVLMFITVYWFFSRSLYESEGQRIEEYADYVADEIDWEDGRVEVDLLDDDIEDISRECLISVYTLEGELLDANHETAWLGDIPRRDGEVQKVDRGLYWQIYDMRVKEDGKEIAWLRLAMPLEDTLATLGHLRTIFFWGVPISLFLSILSGLWITRRALAPIQKITQTACEIEKGDLSKRLGFSEGGDEIAELAATFDQMLDGLEAAFNREKQFTSDASHELRTPIAVIMAHAEEALEDEDATEESYQQALEVIGEKARDMQRMLSQLLMLARGYEQSRSSEMDPLDLDMMVADIAEEMRPQADEKNIRIEVEAEEGIAMEGDLMLLTRMLMNLMDNAIKYGRENGRVLVELRREAAGKDGRDILLAVSDDGQGIPGEDLPHIFDRFYRSDRARSGDGFGLGLSIVKWIVELHGGRIAVDSAEGVGTRFTLHFTSASMVDM